jgi:hypothetical protein
MTRTDRVLLTVLLTVGLALWVVAGKYMIWLVVVASAAFLFAGLVEWMRILFGPPRRVAREWRHR